MHRERLRTRLAASALDLDAVIEHGVHPLEAHAASLNVDPGPWVEALVRFLEQLCVHEVSAWSVTHFVSTPLAAAAGADLAAYEALLHRSAELLSALYAKGASTTRTEQYGLRAAAKSVTSTSALLRAVQSATALAQHRSDPGPTLEEVVGALWLGLAHDESLFDQHLHDVERLASTLAARDVHVGSPVAVGLAALARTPGVTTHWARWLDALGALATALPPADAYGLFEYSVPGLASMALTADELLTAIAVALTVADRGHDPRPTLARGLVSPLAIELGAQLAEAGLEPYYVLTGGLPVFAELGLLNDDGARLVSLALELHAHGHSGRQFFEDGVASLRALHEHGLGLRAVALAEEMARRGLDPGLTFAWGLPTVIGLAERHPAALEQGLALAEALVALDLDPEGALRWSMRPLAELADADVSAFTALRRTLVSVVTTLKPLGVDHHELLSRGVSSLAESATHARAFGELLTKLERVLTGWRGLGLDVSALITTAVPAAARDAAGRPWVLSAALDAAERMGAAGRSAEALRLLEGGLGAVAQAASGDQAVFTESFAALERAFGALPASLSAPAATAACAVGGADARAIEAALDAILSRAHALEHTPALAAALPTLAELSDATLPLGATIDAALEATALVSEARREAWASDGLRALAVCTRGQTSLGLLRPLAAAVRTWEPDTPWALSVLPSVASAAGPRLLDVATKLVSTRRALEAPDEVMPLVVSYVALARDAQTVESMLESLRRHLPSGAQRLRLVQALHHARGLLQRASGWSGLLLPTLNAHGPRAAPVLDALALIDARHVTADSDLEVLRLVVTQQGVRTLDALEGVVLPALRSGVLRSLAEHGDVLLDYLSDFGIHDARIYANYVRIQRDAALSPAERKAQTQALRDTVTALTSAIRDATVTHEQAQDPLFSVALQYVFPPSVSAGREGYEAQYHRMPDRPEDVTRLELTEPLRRREVQVASGSWQLREGVTVDLAPWNTLRDALRLTAPPPEESPEALGWALLSAWSEGRLAQAAVKTPLLARLLRQPGSTRSEVPTLESATELLTLRDVAADGLHTLVEEALLSAKRADEARYARLVHYKLAPAARVGGGLAKAVLKTIDAHRSGELTRAVAAERVIAQLQAFELDGPAVERLLSCHDKQAVTGVLQTLPVATVRVEAAKEVDRVHQELIGQDLSAMRRVLASVLEYRASSAVTPLTFELTKRRAHCLVGFTEGVCVATDVTLWNRPEFFQVVFWNANGICVGGMHVLLVEHDGQRFVSLPGINPSTELLNLVDGAALVDAALKYAWQLARALGCAGVWVPTSPGIHSNRRAVHEALTERALRVRTVSEQSFSTSPYAYVFSEVWDVAEPPAA